MKPNHGEEHVDYVVIGGGSAGCIVAAELSALRDVNVLLLEGGNSAERHPETLTADGYKKAFVNDSLMWDRRSTPQPGCGGRRIFMGSGRGLGGSGSINATVYTRGCESDYAAWDIDGWRWKDVVPHFEALEARLGINRRGPTAFTETCIRASEKASFRRSEDLNDGALDGVLGYEWMNFSGTERRSSYVAFLKPVLQRPNLRVQTDALVKRVVLDDKRRVVAVEYIHQGILRTVHVEKEVILCAGALETPKLLMLSGIGPGSELRAHDIPVLHDRANVGRYFHDHPNVTLFFRGRREVDCEYPQLYGFHRALKHSPLPPEQPDTCYVFYPARSSLREGLMRLLPAMILPEPLYRRAIFPQAIRQTTSLAFRLKAVEEFVKKTYGIVVILGKPESRGALRLASSHAEDHALLDPNYLAEKTDLDAMVEGVKLARRIAHSSPLKSWGNMELFPGPWVKSRARLEKFVRQNVMTTYHYCGTCKMGLNDDDIVDPSLRVRGVKGLRVADASVIPFSPVSALNAPSMMIGYRAAQLVAESISHPHSSAVG